MAISVALVTVAGAPPTDGLAAAFANESIWLDEPSAAPVILAWLPAGSEAGVLATLAGMRRADGACVVIGCAPGGTSDDSERALAAGFDDFVAGRRSVRELAARIRAVVRRLGRPGPGAEPDAPPLVLTPGHQGLWLDGRPIALTHLEGRALAALLSAPGRTLSRRELAQTIWGPGPAPSLRAVDNLIRRLRAKLAVPDLIFTVWNIGFRLDARALAARGLSDRG